MGTDLAPTQQSLSQPPSVIPAALDRTVRFLSSRLTAVGLGYELLAGDAPTAAERRALENRASLLAAWLAPAGPVALIAEMAKVMFMPSRAATTEDTKALIKLYASDLADVPLFATIKACADFRQGRAGDGHWRPTQAEIRKVAQDHAVAARAERRKIETVLTARVVHLKPDPEARKAAATRARAIMAEGAMKAQRLEAERSGKPAQASAPPRTPAPSSEEALDRLKAENAARPMALSDEVRRATQRARAPDPAAWDEQQRLEAEFANQQDHAA